MGQEVDYSGVKVMAAYTYCSELGMGIVLKQDISEIQAPLVIQLLILLFTAFGIAIIGVGIEGVSARHMLKTIEDSWERGKKAVEAEKASFENLVSALYPKFVSERLLAGDTQIVLEVPEV